MARHPYSWLIPLGLAAALAACSTTPPASYRKPQGVDATATTPTPQPSAATPHSLSANHLLDYHWQLEQIRLPSGQEDQQYRQHRQAGHPPVQLSFFSEDRLSVQNLCNGLGASYQITGQRISTGSTVSTQRMCSEPGLMQLERQIGTALGQLSHWHIAQQASTAGTAPSLTLQLELADGSQWTLSGVPTDTTRYGSAPERIFLEVAPEVVACSHPLIPDAQCLRVRSVEYDGQGLLVRKGEWETFHGAIGGFAFEPGVRNILRIHRYTLQNPPADASRYAYVLDMRVESERLR